MRGGGGGGIWRGRFASAVAVALLAVAAQGSMLARDFVWDDRDFLNQMELTGRWRLFAPDPYGFVRPGKALVFSALDALFGGRPTGWEAFGLACVVVASLLVLRFGREFLDARGALAAAAVYAVHPLHVEGAGWAAANNGTLLAICALIYYCLLLNDSRAPRGANVAGMNVLFAAALALKEDAAVVPVIGMLCLWAAGRRPGRRHVLSMAAQLGLAGAFMVYARGRAAGAGQQLEAFPFAPWVMSLSAPRTILSHFLYFYFPFRWSYFHYFDPRPAAFFSMMAAGLAGAGALGVWVWRERRGPGRPLFFVLFAVVALLPVSNLLPMGNYAFAVRYLTHAGIGLALLFGWFVSRLDTAAPRWRPLIRGSLGAWLLAAMVCSSAYHLMWRTEERLFSRLAAEGGHWRFEHLLGIIRYKQGRQAEAEALVREAVRAAPAEAAPRVTLGMILYKEGKTEEAVQLWKSVEEREPANIDMAINLAGYFEAKWARSRDPADRDAAERYYRISAGGRIPNSEAAYVNWGVMWIQAEETEKAIGIWEEGLKAFPGSRDLAEDLRLARGEREFRIEK